MTTTSFPRQTNLAEVLQRRFPETEFEVAPAAVGNSLNILWDGPPDNQLVEVYLRGAGLITDSGPVTGFVRVQSPRQSSQPLSTKRPYMQNPGSAARPKAPLSFGADGLWSVSDLEIIRHAAERWVNTLHKRSSISYYIGGMTMLMVATGFLAWVLDINPSLRFGQHLADNLAGEWISSRILVAIVLLLSVTPNLLEFFAAGLAKFGNVIVDIAVKVALAFDALTDAPMAFSIAKEMVSFFAEAESIWTKLTSLALAIPILLVSTIVVEILFLTFSVSWVLLVKRWFQAR